MRSIVIILFLFLGNRLHSQTIISSVVSQSEIKTFLSEVRLLLIKEPNPRISSTPTQYELSKKFLEHISSMDTIISRKDVDFILTQNDQTKKLSWSNSFFDSVIILDKENESRSFEVYTVSVPYFSIDMQTCIMNIGYYSYKCGTNRLIFLKKINNKWAVYKEF